MTKTKNLLGALVASVLALTSGPAAAYVWNMTEGVTETSQAVYDLHMVVFWICVVACVAVFAVMIYSIMNHRKDKGAVPATFHESTLVEIVWTTIPMIILVALAVPATITLLKLEDTRNADMSIMVTGYQWKWKYDYLDEDISFFSNLDARHNEARQTGSGIDPATIDNYLLEVDNPVVVPINKKIRFLITSNDVIHNWWVPELGWKQDAVPGFINDGWTELKEPGTYYGKCNELCGKDHGFMPIKLIAMNDADYANWVSEQKAAKAAADAGSEKTWTMDELMAKGETVYNTSCAACHQINGQGIPGAFPAIAGGAISIGDKAAHLDMVIKGSKTNPVMAAWGAQLNDADLAAVITYERNAFGNKTGDLIQPADIKAAR